jgi:hypothetical protein
MAARRGMVYFRTMRIFLDTMQAHVATVRGEGVVHTVVYGMWMEIPYLIGIQS